jgi:hypothetical protein
VVSYNPCAATSTACPDEDNTQTHKKHEDMVTFLVRDASGVTCSSMGKSVHVTGCLM